MKVKKRGRDFVVIVAAFTLFIAMLPMTPMVISSHAASGDTISARIWKETTYTWHCGKGSKMEGNTYEIGKWYGKVTEKDGTTTSHLAYCVDPSKNPDEGSGKAIEMSDNATMTQALYYSYGYPEWDTLKKWIEKKHPAAWKNWQEKCDGTVKSPYMLCHFALGYLKNSRDWNAYLTAAETTFAKQVGAEMKALPDPQINSYISFDREEGRSPQMTFLSLQEGFQSPDYTLKGASPRNYVTYQVAEGYSFTNETTGIKYGPGETATIRNGETVHVNAELSMEGSLFATGKLPGHVGDYTAYKFVTDPAYQDIYFFAKGGDDSCSITNSIPALVYGSVSLRKTMETSNGDSVAEEGAEFRLWPEEYGPDGFEAAPDAFKDTLKVGNNGFTAVSRNLPAFADGGFSGRYLVDQTGGSSSVEWLDTVTISINGTGDVQYVDLGTDRLKTSPLKIIKKDVDTGEQVKEPGTRFMIRDNKTGKSYSRDGTTFFETDADGVISWEEFPAGNYTLIEIHAPEDYEEAESVDFTVNGGEQEVCVYSEDRHVPAEIRTSASAADTGNHITKAEGMKTVIDKVSYSHLRKGAGYVLYGILMDKEKNEPVMMDGKEVTAVKSFTAESGSGSVDMSFDIDASELAGKSITVFETLTLDEETVAEHSDIDDQEQMIHFVRVEPPEEITVANPPETGMYVKPPQIVTADRITVDESKEAAGPETGDSKTVYVYMLTAFLASAAVATLFRKKRKQI